MLTPVMSLLRESYLPLHIGPLFLKGWSYRVMVVLNLKPFRYRWHSLFDILDHIEDKWSHRVTKVIFIALVNPSTATIHHQKYLRKISQSNLFPLFLRIMRPLTGATLKKIRGETSTTPVHVIFQKRWKVVICWNWAKIGQKSGFDKW